MYIQPSSLTGGCLSQVGIWFLSSTAGGFVWIRKLGLIGFLQLAGMGKGDHCFWKDIGIFSEQLFQEPPLNWVDCTLNKFCPSFQKCYKSCINIMKPAAEISIPEKTTTECFQIISPWSIVMLLISCSSFIWSLTISSSIIGTKYINKSTSLLESLFAVLGPKWTSTDTNFLVKE